MGVLILTLEKPFLVSIKINLQPWQNAKAFNLHPWENDQGF